MKRVIGALTRLCEAYLPNAFVFGLLLTLVVFGAGLILTPHGPLDLVDFWGRDFWSLNAFAMQMIFVLVSGSMLATTPLVKMILTKLAGRTSSESAGLVILCLFSILTCWINWGFGLIVSGLLALELARKLEKVNFGLFIASAYSGFLVWHGGLSGSIPLKIAGVDEILSQYYPGLSIPLSETIFSTRNLLIVGLLLIILPLLSWFMRTEDKQQVTTPVEVIVQAVPQNNFRNRLEHSPWLNIIFFVLFIILMFQGLTAGKHFDIDRVNLIFLFLAILLHGTPARFLKALQQTFGHASGIAIAFPFYAGIMGIMQHSGLANIISQVFVSISTTNSLPLLAFLSGGVVNFFVPSGGGQWVVQGPVMLKAARAMGVDPAKVAMAVAWGDAWTNMIQPFWTLPLLAMAGIQLKDIMGYCLVFLLASGVVISGVFYFYP
jgi:short-chain fatty acids transporter